jgi:8-oxo-dGTP pyrophosphatase MutT (NUDIX family)
MLKFLNMNRENRNRKVQVIVMAESEILLLKLSEDRGGFWQNVTGGVENDESFLRAAERELFEETGIEKTPSETPFEFTFLSRWNQNVIEKIFVCELEKKCTPNLSEEHQAYKWIPLKNVKVEDYHYATNFLAVEWLQKTC